MPNDPLGVACFGSVQVEPNVSYGGEIFYGYWFPPYLLPTFAVPELTHNGRRGLSRAFPETFLVAHHQFGFDQSRFPSNVAY